ncbi:MAG: hypothetical protein AB7S90_03445 [Marinobacterium sp.]
MEKFMKKGVFLATVMLALTACQSNNQLKPVSQIKPGVASEGTLANAQLVSDTTAALEQLPEGLRVKPGARIFKFVVQQPVGVQGSRAWREMWIADPKGASTRFLITFTEAGLGAADFQIQPMK